MSPSLIARMSTVALLLLGTVSAEAFCPTLVNSPPSDAVCGTRGVSDSFFGYTIADDTNALTPEACAKACFEHSDCMSVLLTENNCQLMSRTQAFLGFWPKSDGAYQAFDISCFGCEATPTPTPAPVISSTTTTSQVPTSSAITSTTTTLPLETFCPTLVESPPPNSVCGTKGTVFLDGRSITTYRGIFTGPQCAVKCAEHSECISFLIGSDWCELKTNTQKSLIFSPSEYSWYVGWDMSCFGCPSTPTPTPEVISSTTTSEVTSSSTITSTAIESLSSLTTSSTTIIESTTTTSESSSITSASISTTATPVSSTVSVPFPAGNTTLPAGTGTGTGCPVSSTALSSTITPPYPAGNTTSHAGTGTGTGSPVSTTSSSFISSTALASSTLTGHSSSSQASSTTSGHASITSSSLAPSVTQFTTSTIYATQTFTIPSCPPVVTNCPYGSVTTVTVAISTTVCPVAAVESGSVKSTGGAGSGSESGSGSVSGGIGNGSGFGSEAGKPTAPIATGKPAGSTSSEIEHYAYFPVSASSASTTSATTAKAASTPASGAIGVWVEGGKGNASPTAGGIKTSTISAGGLKPTSTGTNAPLLGVTGAAVRIGGVEKWIGVAMLVGGILVL